MNIKIVSKLDLHPFSKDKPLRDICFEDIRGLDKEIHDLIVYVHTQNECKLLKDRYDGIYQTNVILTEHELHDLILRSLSGYMVLELIRIKNNEDERTKNKEFENAIYELSKKYDRSIITMHQDGSVFMTNSSCGAKMRMSK